MGSDVSGILAARGGGVVPSTHLLEGGVEPDVSRILAANSGGSCAAHLHPARNGPDVSLILWERSGRRGGTAHVQATTRKGPDVKRILVERAGMVVPFTYNL